MRSRVLLGAGAWLLGAVSATTGSLYAVNQLGSGILSQPSQRFPVASVRIDLRHGKPAPGRTGPRSVSQADGGSRPHGQLPSTAAGRLLDSAAGTAFAVCQAGQAYLEYWSPAQGFADGNVQRGPATVATVTFSAHGSGVVLRVSCLNGTPEAQALPFSSSAQHDD